MIALWMIYSVGVSGLLALAAVALERGLRLRGAPLRGIWVGALLGSLALSLTPWLLRTSPAAAVDESFQVIAPEHIGSATPSSATEARPPALPAVPAPPTSSRAPARTTISAALPSFESVDRPLLYGWAAASGLLALLLVASLRNLLRQRRSWRAGEVDGVRALVSEKLGPAVVGFFRARIVLPEWVLGLEERQRALVVAHEVEHLRAGDTRLLGLALLSAVVMPWNPALWWQIRRLRHAVELDCDARVLRRRPDVRSYTSLLLELGQRRAPRALAVAAFAESSSLLERRIETIVTPRSRRWRLPVAIAAAVTLALVVLAFEVPRPALAQTRPRPDVLQPVAVSVRQNDPGQPVTEAPAVREAKGAPAARVATERPSRVSIGDTLQSRFQPEELAALTEKEYPAALRSRGIEGEATLRFVVGRQGKAQQVEVLAGTRPEFVEAAKRVVEQLPFWPARAGEQIVEDRVSAFKVSFRLHRAARTTRAAPNAVERLLHAAIAEYYPELLREETTRTPYVYLVVDPRGNVLHRALEWSRPSTPVIRDAILNHFPDLPRTRSAVPGGAGYSVRTGIPGGKDIEVFWATLEESAAPAGPVRWGPYPLDAVSPGQGFPGGSVRNALQERYARELQQGLPEGTAVWFIATSAGELLNSGIASQAEIHERLTAWNDSSAFFFITFLDAADGAKIKAFGSVPAPEPREAGVISGRVTDEAGNGIVGATILFRDQLKGTVTRENGEYRLSNVPPGSYTLIARHPGGGEVSQEVSIGASGGARADFVLRGQVGRLRSEAL